MTIDAIFFDLDDTLYPAASGVWRLIRERISLYMHERMQISWEEIPEIRRTLFEKYGTTGRGLKALYDIDEQDYQDFVHDVPIREYLSPDPALREMLLSMPQRRIIFTNAIQEHANRVTDALQIADCFEQVIDIDCIRPTCKPFPEAYRKALQIAGITDPCTCLVIDDSPKNLNAAQSLGCPTLLIAEEGQHPDWENRIARLIDLPLAVRSLRKG